jgi:hypothetical protein
MEAMYIIHLSSLDMSYPPSRGKSQKVVPVKMRVYSNWRHAS